eukprot:SAG11_NODE_4724_length_1791_cov_11.385934_2_plen_59_part_00
MAQVEAQNRQVQNLTGLVTDMLGANASGYGYGGGSSANAGGYGYGGGSSGGRGEYGHV